jgi:hypothetical protein
MTLRTRHGRGLLVLLVIVTVAFIVVFVLLVALEPNRCHIDFPSPVAEWIKD